MPRRALLPSPRTTHLLDGTAPAAPALSLVQVALRNEDELPVLLEMMRAGGHATYDSVIRAALYKHAIHLGLDVPRRIFSLTTERETEETLVPTEQTNA